VVRPEPRVLGNEWRREKLNLARKECNKKQRMEEAEKDAGRKQRQHVFLLTQITNAVSEDD
jgi:hypothetical protein